MTQAPAPPPATPSETPETSETRDGPLLAPGTQFIFSELSAMAMDGVLCHVYGQVFRLSSWPETPAVRAGALAHYIPAFLIHRAVLGQLTAAWVYGCGPMPAEIALLVDNDGNSASLPRRSGCSVRQVRLGEQDLCRIGSTRVTTPLRTALDVARSAPRATARPVLAAMAANPTLECPLDGIHRGLLAAPHVPGKLRGTDLLAAMIAGFSGGASPAGPPTRQARRWDD